MSVTRPGTRRPTLEEVAARAGVGRGTASRVINGSPHVSDEARRAVQQAIEELGYIPNRAARSLVTRRTDSVALVVSEPEERVFAEPFFAGIIRGIGDALADTPLSLWLAMARSPEQRERLEGHLTSQHVDGALLLSLHDDDPLPARLEARGVPTVLGGRTTQMLEGADGSWFVDVDNVEGARRGVDRLVGLGRSRIAAIAGPEDMGVGVARLAGYREALAAAGLPDDHGLVAFGDFSEPSGAEAMATLLEVHPDLDAVFVASDLMAAGALRVLRDRGRAVPDEIAVTAFEDSAIVADNTSPRLTTVRQPVEEMGRRMAELLLARIGGEEVDRQVLLETELVVRDSA